METSPDSLPQGRGPRMLRVLQRRRDAAGDFLERFAAVVVVALRMAVALRGLWRYARAKQQRDSEHDARVRSIRSTSWDQRVRTRFDVDDSTAWVLDRLAGDPIFEVRVAVAAYRPLPEHLAVQLTTDTDTDVRTELARNPTTATSALLRLACDIDPQVRCVVAERNWCPDQVWDQMATNPDPDVHQAMTWNPHTPSQALARLARSPHRHIREGAAGHSRTDPITRWALLQDDDYEVRCATMGWGTELSSIALLDEINAGAYPDLSARAVESIVLAALEHGDADTFANVAATTDPRVRAAAAAAMATYA